MKGRLKEYALLAEIIGAIAIVVSLLFVGIQVRQSNSLATTDAIRDGTQIWVGAYREVFGSSESTAFFRRAINHCEELTSDERGRFFAVLGSLISAYDNIYNQHANGRLRDEIYISIAANYFGIVNMPCAQQTMARDYKLLPAYLRDFSVVGLLADHVDDMEPPTFLTE